MLLLVNSNRMLPPIAPVGLEYVGQAARAAGIAVRVADLCLAEDPDRLLREAFGGPEPSVVGISFRNADDCFWPSAASFVGDLVGLVRSIRSLTAAPVALGGVGYSIFAASILEETGADFGIRGDGEAALMDLARELRGEKRFERVPGLLWRACGRITANPPAWPARVSVEGERELVDNGAYFRRGGQLGVETKRGCGRPCVYCADPLAKGDRSRRRDPAEVAREVEGLLRRGIDVLHLCDSEFNVPQGHAREVCRELVRRGLGDKVRWYAYLAVKPFDGELAALMRRAGCAGINFTTDSASPALLAAYRQGHGQEDIARAVRLCRESGIAVMLDLLLGGPGETPESLAETIGFVKKAGPDCAGAALGLRIYPGTELERMVLAEGPPESNRALRRRHGGPVDFFHPTFYISTALGERPAELVRGLVAGDERFFEPLLELPGPSGVSSAEGAPCAAPHPAADPASNYNYNDNTPLARAIAAGARGAYWDILRKLRERSLPKD